MSDFISGHPNPSDPNYGPYLRRKQAQDPNNMTELELDANRRERIPMPRQDEQAHSGQERIGGHNPSLGPDPFGRRDMDNVGNRGDVDTP